MDARAEKLANARRKLRDHQEKKTQKDCADIAVENNDSHNNTGGIQNRNVEEIINICHDENNTDSRNEVLIDDHGKDRAENKIQDVNMAEYLIYNQKCLENEIQSLQNKLTELNSLYSDEQINHNKCKQKINILESEISNLSDKYSHINEDLKIKDVMISELKNKNQILLDENNNLNEQLDFTKTMLTSKESDNAQLHNQVCLYYNQLEAARLQVQQLTNDTTVNIHNSSNNVEIDQLQTKISGLEQKIAIMQQERENLTSHYEHYMKDLTTQLNSTTLRNEDLSKEVNRLYDRESSLIDQISDMEIRIQNFNKKDFEIETQLDTSEMQKQLMNLQLSLDQSEKVKGELQKQYDNAMTKIKELEQLQKSECEHDALSVTKLSADITSDKIAAQRATEQNVKLKSDIEDLQQVIVKMTKDKLELTEMLTHEKNLNKELMLKLADIEELGKNVHNKLRAKDEEMMRLQNESRELVKKYNDILENQPKHSSCNNISEHNEHCHDLIEENTIEPEDNNNISDTVTEPNTNEENNVALENDPKNHCIIPKEDAMLKLQQRFMNIMDEVANLSDEKHRLEHIILQLQNETDTICEYVALYQQQRSLLKKRDEERTHQLKMFEKECNELKYLLGELRDLLFRLAEDKEISMYLKTDARNADMARIWELLKKLQNSSLLNKHFKSMDLNSFYPCSCCSGKLIDV